MHGIPQKPQSLFVFGGSVPQTSATPCAAINSTKPPLAVFALAKSTATINCLP